MEKYCPKCKTTKNISEFRKNKSKPDGLGSYCSKCAYEINEQYRKKNPEKHAKNTSDWSAKNPLYEHHWATINKNKVIEKTQRYQNKKRNLECDFSEKDWGICLFYFNHACAYCGKQSDNLQREHFIPVTKGGGYTFSNIVPACQSCNASKCDKEAFNWLIKKFGYEVAQKRTEKINHYFYGP